MKFNWKTKRFKTQQWFAPYWPFEPLGENWGYWPFTVADFLDWLAFILVLAVVVVVAAAWVWVEFVR